MGGIEARRSGGVARRTEQRIAGMASAHLAAFDFQPGANRRRPELGFALRHEDGEEAAMRMEMADGAVAGIAGRRAWRVACGGGGVVGVGFVGVERGFGLVAMTGGLGEVNVRVGVRRA